MSFQQLVIASFIGTFFGFMFAIILFLITNAIIEYRKNINLLKHLKREFEYDISLLQGWIDEIDKILRNVGNDLEVYSYIKFVYFQRAFMQQAFLSGIMYNKFNNDDISKLNQVLLHCDVNKEQYVNYFITQWEKKQIDKKDVLTQFEFEKASLQTYKKDLQQLLEKLNQL